MQFKGKTDWSTSLGLLAGVVGPAYIAMTQNLPWLSAASFLAILLFFALVYPQRYETTSEALVVRSGFSTRLIPYERLRGVRKAEDGRTMIEYDTGSFAINPADPQAFMDAVRRYAPQVVKE